MDENLAEYTANLLRMQRHDFMNYMQVIMGYIQIKRPDKAFDYIKGINAKMNGLSKIYNLENPSIALLLHEFIEKLDKCGINSLFYTKADIIKNDNILQCFSTLRNYFNDIYLDNEKYGKDAANIYIELCDNKDDTYILINDTLSFDELDYVKINENNMCSLWKYSNNNEKGYKINIKRGDI